MRKLYPLLLTSALLAGCAAAPSSSTEDEWKPDPHAGDHGPYPDNYEEVVKTWYEANLKDPESARYVSFSRPREEHAITNVHQQEAVYGWSTCATVNARNSYGGYTGPKTRWFLLRDGEIVTTRDTALGIIYRGRRINCDDGS